MNGTYALFAIPSIGVEVGIAPKATFQLDATMSFWNSINDRPWVFNQKFPEIRYYFKDKNDGFYSGVHVGYGMFKLSKNSSYAKNNQYQYGYIWFTGATIGYQWKVKENWSLEKRIEVIEMLWKVCLVDGVLEPYEDMLIRRVSGLIYVDDKNRNIAKNNALKSLNKK